MKPNTDEEMVTMTKKEADILIDKGESIFWLGVFVGVMFTLFSLFVVHGSW